MPELIQLLDNCSAVAGMKALSLNLEENILQTDAAPLFRYISLMPGLEKLKVTFCFGSGKLWLWEMVNNTIMASDSISILHITSYVTLVESDGNSTTQRARLLLPSCRSKLKELYLSPLHDFDEELDNIADEGVRFLTDLLLHNHMLEKVQLHRFPLKSSNDVLMDLIPSMSSIRQLSFPTPVDQEEWCRFAPRDLKKLVRSIQACPTLTSVDYLVETQESTETGELKQAVTDCLEINKMIPIMKHAALPVFAHAMANRRPSTIYFLLQEKNNDMMRKESAA
jgi:hypothetical protein